MNIRKLWSIEMASSLKVVSKASTSTTTTAPLIGTTMASSMYRSFGTEDTSANRNDDGQHKDNHVPNSTRPKNLAGKQRPNRFTSIYTEMQQTCRDEIETYAKCVILAQQQEKTMDDKNSGTTYHMCAAEFAPVKECFRAVRRQLRQQQQ
jgi:hypothetical protein